MSPQEPEVPKTDFIQKNCPQRVHYAIFCGTIYFGDKYFELKNADWRWDSSFDQCKWLPQMPGSFIIKNVAAYAQICNWQALLKSLPLPLHCRAEPKKFARDFFSRPRSNNHISCVPCRWKIVYYWPMVIIDMSACAVRPKALLLPKEYRAHYSCPKRYYSRLCKSHWRSWLFCDARNVIILTQLEKKYRILDRRSTFPPRVISVNFTVGENRALPSLVA